MNDKLKRHFLKKIKESRSKMLGLRKTMSLYGNARKEYKNAAWDYVTEKQQIKLLSYTIFHAMKARGVFNK